MTKNNNYYTWYLKLNDGTFLVPTLYSKLENLNFVEYCRILRLELTNFTNGKSIICASNNGIKITSIRNKNIQLIIECYRGYVVENSIKNLKDKRNKSLKKIGFDFERQR